MKKESAEGINPAIYNILADGVRKDKPFEEIAKEVKEKTNMELRREDYDEAKTEICREAMLQQLVKIANKLDEKGAQNEADALDKVIANATKEIEEAKV
jgi:hypothetical protein